uniref:VQ domain-containing protein n=1 Tax=Oryza meridionalis TaxID=40149 RepID=A0A0E0EGR2_9ORYZ
MEQQLSSPSASQRGGGRELQGPRPAPLKVRKESHKIRKQEPVQQLRQPVIIYTMSPKVVHANAADFMSVVQRLTGAPPQPQPQPHHPTLLAQMPPQPSFPFHLQQQDAWPQQHSPAARLAAIEHAAARSSGADLPPLPSILSPVPGTLPAIPPSFFSPPSLISPAAPFLGATTTSSAAPSQSPIGGSAYYWDLFNNINMQH